jgi:hypothetical protein
VSNIKLKFALPDTRTFTKFCEANLRKQTELCDEFYKTCTMENKNWKSKLLGRQTQHVFTHFACHGTHTKLYFDVKGDLCVNRVISIIKLIVSAL